MKAHEKLESLGEQLNEYNIDHEQVDLCKCIYKLHFQLVLMLESFAKLLRLISHTFESVDTSVSSGEGDHSSTIFVSKSYQVAVVQRELVKAFQRASTGAVEAHVRTPTPTFAGKPRKCKIAVF